MFDEIFERQSTTRLADGRLVLKRVFRTTDEVIHEASPSMIDNVGLNFPAYTVRAEKPFSVENPDGTFDVTFRFTLLPKADTPLIVENP